MSAGAGLPVLLVDAGNSRIKWVLAEAGVRRGPGSAAAHDGWRRHWQTIDRPARVLVSSVAGTGLDRAIDRWCRQQWQLAAQFVTAGPNACGVHNGYERPEELGSDRWAALIGARDLHDGPCVVVDCGTAITVDSLDASGRFPGGVIIPGADTLAQAVVARAARLSGTGGWHPEPIGRSTAEGIAAGATSAVLGGIARVIAFFEQRFGAAALTVFVTGGHGSEVAPLLGRPVRVEPDLVLHGLAVLSESLR